MPNLRDAIFLEIMFATWVGDRAYSISSEWPREDQRDIRKFWVKRARALFAEG